jgi:molybdopterin converting factor small subunit
VTVVCFGALRDYLPPGATGNTGVVEMDVGARVRDLIERLGAPRGMVHALLVDGASASDTDVLTDGAEVTLMPPFTGGRAELVHH